MTKIILFLILVLGQPPEWVELPEHVAVRNKFYSNATLDKNKWRGFPDPNYVWEGDMLSWEREVIDEHGNPKMVKTYKKPIEIIAKFKPQTKIYGVDKQGKIEKAAVEKFGGSLKGFVWITDVEDGGGEVVLPFTVEHIFIAKGDRLNPVLSEISTDTSADNYYETFEGKTHVYVKAFSGIGGAAGAPSTLIAHWPMNEDTADDNAELVTNGTFDSDVGWTKDGTWAIAGGVASGDGDSSFQFFAQNLTSETFGRKYRLAYEITANTFVGATNLGLSSAGLFGIQTISGTVGIHSYFFLATNANPLKDIRIFISNNTTGGSISIDNISAKLCAAEDSSGNDHDGLLQEDTDAAHVTGKTGTGAFDFDGISDYIEIDDADAFTPAGSAYSISIWLNPHDLTSFPIVTKGVEGTDGEWSFYTDSSDKIIVHRYDESINKYIGRKYNTALTTYQNQWIHLVMTSDGGVLSSGLKIYLNAIRIDDTNDESATFISIENLTGSVWIGYDGTNFADGLFDNLTIFSTELDIDKIEGLFNEGSGTEVFTDIDQRRGGRRR